MCTLIHVCMEGKIKKKKDIFDLPKKKKASDNQRFMKIYFYERDAFSNLAVTFCKLFCLVFWWYIDSLILQFLALAYPFLTTAQLY